MRENTLYYPYFIPQSIDWLASSLLWWEKMYLIWPRGVNITDKIIETLSEVDVIQTIDPNHRVNMYANMFVQDVLKPNLEMIAKEDPVFSESIYLHTGKLGYLMDYLDSMKGEIGARYHRNFDSSISLDKNIEVPYMSFLADKLARNLGNSVDTITDDDTYLKFFGPIKPLPKSELDIDRESADVAVLANLKDVVLKLENFKEKDVSELLKFREKYSDEREKFRDSVTEIFFRVKEAMRLQGKESSDIITEVSTKLRDNLLELESHISRTKLRASIADLSAVLVGAISFTGAVDGQIGQLVAGGGTIVGWINARAITHKQIQEIKQNHPMTYLYQVNSQFGKRSWRSKIKTRN